ncbi:MAG: MFS transporter [Erysipelotrichaceae bacterium]|nr:MFS transporter [Erysipelotrichaceae bacterium]MDD4642976.1 MFS transporter [Erysipelotrichaceae bacterium]
MDIYQTIKKDKQIVKFSFYGFFKNLKFFEPYLLIYLNSLGYDLFAIGIFFAIRAGVTYVFEVPSAMVADYYGKKNELLICFGFYIISFILFLWARDFFVVALGMIFFGLGEAFRSGTHKAMILSYLEQKGWFDHKGFVYGRTRSYSLLGSALSAFLSIIFVLQLPALKWVFAISIVPYILDFILIASYPNSLNERFHQEKDLGSFWKNSIKQVRLIFSNNKILRVVFSGSSYDGVFKTIKDYIQPIMSMIILSAGVGTIASLSQDQSLKVYLGLIYGVFYIVSSMASKNIFKATSRFGQVKVFEIMYDLMGILLILLSITVGNDLLYITMAIYFILYFMTDARRPTFLEVSSDHMDKEQRVTVLSIESQLRAFFMMIFAPVFGFIAETVSLSALFLMIGIIMLIANRFLHLKSED